MFFFLVPKSINFSLFSLILHYKLQAFTELFIERMAIMSNTTGVIGIWDKYACPCFVLIYCAYIECPSQVLMILGASSFCFKSSLEQYIFLHNKLYYSVIKPLTSYNRSL